MTVLKDLKKKDLIEKIAADNEITKKAAGEIVEGLIDTIIKTVKKGGSVDIAGLGKFELKKRKARKGINPATKEAIKIPATKVPAFKAAKAFKEAVK